MSGESALRFGRASKVLMTADAVGGVWQYSVDLATEFTSRGVQVLLAVLGGRPSEGQRQQLASVPGVQLVESEHALEWMPNPWDDVHASAEWLQQLEAEFQPDLIHLNGYSHAAFTWSAPVLVVAHSCVSSWWRAVHRCDAPFEWDEYRRRVSAGLSAASAVVSPSHSMAAALSECYGLPTSRVRIISNFSLQPEYTGRKKEDVVLAAGRVWDEAKNLAVLNRVAADIPWPIRIAGPADGNRGRAMDADRVQLLGNLSRAGLTDQQHAASIFVHPALYEPFGLAVLEAARSRCSLVLSDIPTFREFWDGAAVFVDPRDPQHIAYNLNRLCCDSGLRDGMAHKAFARSREYSAATTVAKYLDLYRSLAPAVENEGAAAA